MQVLQATLDKERAATATALLAKDQQVMESMQREQALFLQIHQFQQ